MAIRAADLTILAGLLLLTGAATHLMAEWEPARGIEEIQRFGCTAAVTAPTFLHGLLSEYDAERHDLSRLRLWVCAGAPIPAAVPPEPVRAISSQSTASCR